jgi:hypothetical protein
MRSFRYSLGYQKLHEGQMLHANRPIGITKRTVRPISLSRAGPITSFTGNTEAWAK